MKRGQMGARKRSQRKRKLSCVECGSIQVLPILYDPPGIRMKVPRGQRFVLAERDDWEGMPEWHCESCGCEWRGEWKRFRMRARKPGDL